MIAALVVSSGLALAAGDTPRAAGDEAAYREAVATAAPDADAQLRLALWCESHGLNPERVKHLARAVLADPTNAAARGLMGLVAHGGKWKRPEAVADALKADADLAAALAEYNARRDRAGGTADAQWKLAQWCESKGLTAEAQAHYTAVVRLEPSREAAWKKLGCRKVGGRWVTEAQLAAEKAETEAQKQADRKWRPLLGRHLKALNDRNPARRAEAVAALDAVTDPRAVPSVWLTLATGGPAAQSRAVAMLGRIESPGASRGLAILAVSSPDAEVRRTAVESLRRRDPNEFLDLFIALLAEPLQYDVRPVNGPGSTGVLTVRSKTVNVQRRYSPPPLPNLPLFPGEPVSFDAEGLPVISRMLGLFNSQGPTQTYQMTQAQFTGEAPPPDPALGPILAQARANPASAGALAPVEVNWSSVRLNRRFHQTLSGDQTAVTVTATSNQLQAQTVEIPIGRIVREHERAAAVAGRQLEADVERVEAYNRDVREMNGRVALVLSGLTGQSLGEDRETWAAWWADQKGYAYVAPKTDPVTVSEDVPTAYQPEPVPLIARNVNIGNPTTTATAAASINPALLGAMGAAGWSSHNCFAAGTPVRTIEGARPIESLRVGDRVLTQNTRTGALSFEPVVAVYHNKPGRTLKLDLRGAGPVVATPIHRFWKAGQGWVMARDLQPGDVLRGLGATATVRSVTDEPVQPVFNIQVAAGQSFFVGDPGLLVHDNSTVTPETAPFDAPPAVAGTR